MVSRNSHPIKLEFQKDEMRLSETTKHKTFTSIVKLQRHFRQTWQLPEGNLYQINTLKLSLAISLGELTFGANRQGNNLVEETISGITTNRLPIKEVSKFYMQKFERAENFFGLIPYVFWQRWKWRQLMFNNLRTKNCDKVEKF